MKKAIPFLLCIGVALGALLHSLSRESRPQSPPVASKNEVLPAGIGEEAVPEIAPPSAISLAREFTADSPISRLAAAIEQIPSPEVDRNWRIEGVAVDADGEPAPRVRIRLTPTGYSIPGVEMPRHNLQRGDFTEYVVDRVIEHRFVHEATHTTTTDTQGRFLVEGLPWARYGITAEYPAAEYPGGESAMEIQVDEQPRTFAFPMEWVLIRRVAVYSVTFDVLLPDGSRSDAVEISGAGETFAWTPNHRTFRVRGGEHSFQIVGETAELSRARATVRGDRVDRPIVLRRSRAGEIELTVEFPPDEDESGYHYWYAAVAPGGVVDAAWILDHGQENSRSARFRSSFRQGRRSGSIVDGVAQADVSDVMVRKSTAKIPGLPPAEYVVAIGRTEDSIDEFTTVMVEDGAKTEVSLSIAPVAPEAVIEVRVYDPDGEPMGNVQLRLEKRKGFQEDTVECATLQRPDGSYWLRPPEIVFEIIEGRAEGQMVLYVDTGGLGQREIELDSTFVEVRFAQPARLFLTIDGLREEEHPRLQIFDVGGNEVGEFSLDDKNRNGFGPIESGDVLVSVSTWSGGGSRALLEPFWLTLAPGENHHRVAVAARYELTVDLSSSIGNRALVLMRADSTWIQGSGSMPMEGDNSTDRKRFSGLLPGRYVLLLSNELKMEFAMMEVSVPETSQVVFEGKPVLAFFVRVADYMQGDAPFEDGDLIIGANGRVFESSEELVQTIQLSPGGAPTLYLVERDGAQLQIEVSQDTLMNLIMRGGQFIPATRD